jgi:hypothetical protein
MTSLAMVWFLVVNTRVTKLALHVGQVSKWSKELVKAVFEGSRRWLQRDHPYRTHPNVAHFISAEELRTKPCTTTGVDTLKWAQRTKKRVARGNILGLRGCPSKETRSKRQYALFKFPY